MARGSRGPRVPRDSRDEPEQQPPPRRRQGQSAARGARSVASSSSQPPPATSTHPWPRPDNLPFDTQVRYTTLREIQMGTEYLRYKDGDPWAGHHSIFYDGLLQIEMAPTKFVDELTLHKMGIKTEVRSMLQRIGLGNIAYQTYPLYPELVRQFLASAELHYRDGAIPMASEGTLSFFSSGVRYEVSLRELCTIYGFDESPEFCRFPTDFEQASELWYLIGSGGYESRGAKLSYIRNPVIRVVAKILGNIMFAKDESGALRKDELMLLHFGLPDLVQEIYSVPPPDELRTNLGAVFAEILVSRKLRGLRPGGRRVERIGSLLTPIFRHCEIDLSTTPCEPTLAYFDEQYLRNSGILKPGFIYQFVDRDRQFQYCKLPLRDHTAPTSLENIEFLLGQEFLHQYPATRRRGSSSRAAASEPHLEDDVVPDSFARHSQASDQSRYDLPPYTGEYDLAPLAADATDAEYRAWVVDSHRKSHSMMRRMWDAISRRRCPSCFRAAGTRGRPRETEPAAHAPDVAGHRTAAVDDDDDESSDPDARLPRRRRRQGQSQSVSPRDP